MCSVAVQFGTATMAPKQSEAFMQALSASDPFAAVIDVASKLASYDSFKFFKKQASLLGDVIEKASRRYRWAGCS
jgi:hypothetical protein